MGNNSYRKFIKLSSLVTDNNLKNEFFDLFLTPEERKDIGQRLEIVFELLKGEHPQREIAKNLNTSIAKITRGSNCLKSVSSDLKEVIKKLSELTTTS
jgi:TrpR family trp operon transcriptional repressor